MVERFATSLGALLAQVVVNHHRPWDPPHDLPGPVHGINFDRKFSAPQRGGDTVPGV